MVRNYVLAAQLIPDSRKRVLHIFLFIRVECASAGGFGNALQNFVAPEDQSAVIRRDGIYDDFRALRHFNCLRLAELTLIIFAVTDHDDRAARRTVFMILHQIVAASTINGVVQRRSTAVAHAMNSGREQRTIVGETLHNLAMAVEGNHKSFVEIGTNGVLQETHCRVLFEVEPRPHRSAGVDQEPKLNGKVSLAAEIHNRLRWLMIVKNREVFLIEVAHKFAMFVSGNEQHIDFVYPGLDGDYRFIGIKIRGASRNKIIAGDEIRDLCAQWHACHGHKYAEQKILCYVLHSHIPSRPTRLFSACHNLRTLLDARRGPKYPPDAAFTDRTLGDTCTNAKLQKEHSTGHAQKIIGRINPANKPALLVRQMTSPEG